MPGRRGQRSNVIPVGRRRQAGVQVGEVPARGLVGVPVDRGLKSVEGLAHGHGPLGQNDPDRHHRLPAGPIRLHLLTTTLRRRHPLAERVPLLPRLHHIGQDRTHLRQLGRLRPR